MPEEGVPGPAGDRRVVTGCPGLDAMLEGGFVPRRPYLVVGPSGTGKTTLSLQFLLDGVRRGERCLFVTLEEPPNEVRVNHRNLGPELDDVEVFDAIPDIMRYERVPFKDIASVRAVTPFKHVPLAIRRSPELTAVEVTMTALEQMLRTEVVRRGYSRLVVDSLTALQYFCMKGYDPVAGAQAFLRFLSDLHVTTILTVESPLEDVETPERMLARGEVRLFRWELDERTVRAVGVEKFRGSPHDVRLHPYRIGPKGIDINLETTISRDTRQIIEPAVPVSVRTPTPIPLEEVTSPVDPLAEQVRDLVVVGAEMGPVRTEIEAALGDAASGALDRARGHLSRASALIIDLSAALREGLPDARASDPEAEEAYQRIVQRGEAARAGLPPTKLPPQKVLEVQLEWVLSLIPTPAAPLTPPEVEAEPVEPGGPAPGEPELTETVVPEPVSAAPPEEQPAAAEASVPLPEPAGVPGPSAIAAVPADEEVAAPPAPLNEPGPSEMVAPEPVPLPPASAAPAPPPLRAWTAPPAPTAPPPMPASRGKQPAPELHPRSAASAPARSGVPTPGVSAEERPPLPSIPSGPSVALPSRAREVVAPLVPPPAVVAPTPAKVAPPSHTLPSHAAAPPAPPVVAEGTAPKRRRKPAAAVRKKAAGAPAPSLGAPPAAAPAHPSGVAAPPAAEKPPAEAAVAPAKPKRRSPRKKKAPAVLTATAGTIPPGVFGTSAASSSEAPPTAEPDARKEGP